MLVVPPLQLPELQSEFLWHVLLEQSPVTTPPQVAAAFLLVHSDVNQQEVGDARVHVPWFEPLQVPLPQSALILHVGVEQLPVTAPVQAAPAFRLAQSDWAQQFFAAGTQLPMDSPLQVPVPHSASALQVADEQLPSAPPVQLAQLELPQSDFW